MKIEDLSQKELADLISRANKRKKVLAKRKPANQTKAAVERLLRSAGWSFSELYGNAAGGSSAGAKPARAQRAAAKGPRKAASKVAAKYRNPANANETWSGRGKRPRWLAAAIDGGRKLEEFAI